MHLYVFFNTCKSVLTIEKLNEKVGVLLREFE